MQRVIRRVESAADVAISADACDITGSTNVILSDTSTGDADVICVEVENTHATVALDDLQLQVQAHPDAAWVLLTATWSALIADTLLYYSGNLKTLGAGLKMSFKANVKGWYAWRLQASGNASATTAEARGTVIGEIG